MNAMMNITVRMTAASAKKEIDMLRAKIRELETEIKTLRSVSSSMIPGGAFAAIGKWGSQLQWAGRQLVTNFTMPLALAGGLVTKWVLGNEAAMVRIKKVYGDARTGPQEFAQDMNGLGQAFDLLSVKYAKSREDVMNIAADWAAAGATGGALARSVETTLKVMTLGEMDAAAATQALIAIQAQYGADTKSLIGIIEVLNATENTTGVTFQGLVDGMSRSASAARSAGVDVDHLAAMIAAISPAAGSAGQAGNALKTIFSRMIGPTGEARDVLALMGINIDDVGWKSLNGAERLERLADAYMHLETSSDGMISAQAGVVSAVVASRWQINRFDVLMRDLAYHIDGNAETNGYYTKTLDLLKDKAAVAALAQSELNAVLESNPEMVKRAGVVIQNSLMKVVTALLPQIMWLVNGVASMAKAFSNLDPGLQKMIIGFLAFLALLGPPLVLLGSMAVAIGQLGKMFVGLWGALKIVGTGFAKVGGWGTTAAEAISGAFGKMRAQVATTLSTVVGTTSAAFAETTAAAAAGGASAGAAWGTAYPVVPVTGIRDVEAAYVSSSTEMVVFARAAGTAQGTAWGTALLGSTESALATQRAMVTGQAAITAGTASSAMVVSSGAAGAAASAGFGSKLMMGLRAMGPAIGRAMLTAVTFISGSWGWAIAAVLALLFIFRKQIGELFSNIGRDMQDATTPVGKAWAFVTDVFNKGTSFVVRSMRAMPEGIAGALQAVINLVKTAAMKVYGLFSYMNPFAHHSPSLVENVTNGLAIVGAQFGLVANVIKAHMLNAYGSLASFGVAVASFMSRYKAMVEQADNDLVGRQAGASAVAAMVVLRAQLAPLEKDYKDLSDAVRTQQDITDALSNALQTEKNAAKILSDQLEVLDGIVSGLGNSLSKAKQELEDMASMPIEGMRAMGDAIFDNQMAVKAIQLQMLLLNDTSLGDLNSQLAALQGEIESVRGTQSDLRNAGAGNDVLSAYQDQIDALESQQAAIEGQAAPLNDLEQQLKQLQKTGEILDLQNSLAFDPLTRQVDRLANAYSELPFADIMANIVTQRAAVDTLQTAYDQANAELELQQVLVDAAAASVATAQLAYDQQAATLDTLKNAYQAVGDEISEIKNAIDEVIRAAQEMETSLSSARGSSDRISPAAQNFLGAAGGEFPDVGDAFTIGDEQLSIDQWLEDFAATSSDMFAGVDMLSPIKIKWEEFKNWWSTTINPFFTNIGTGIADAFKGVDWLAPFRVVGDEIGKVDWMAPIRMMNDFFGGDSTVVTAVKDWWARVSGPLNEAMAPLKEALTNAWAELQPALEELGTALKGAFDGWKSNMEKLWAVVGPILGALGDAFMWWWGKVQIAWGYAEPVIVFIGKLIGGIIAGIIAFLGALAIVWANIFGNVIGPVIETLSSYISGVITWLSGLITFITGVFTGDWGKAWEGIKTMFTATWDTIVGVFSGLWNTIKGYVDGVIEGVKSAWEWLADILVGHSIIPDMIDSIVEWFKGLPGRVIKFITELVTKAIQFFSGLAGDVLAGIGNVATSLYTKGSELVTGLSNGILSAWETIKTWFTGLVTLVITTLGDTASSLYDKGVDFLVGLYLGILTKWEELKTWVTGLATLVFDTLGEVKETLKQKGIDFILGVYNGVVQKWEDLKAWYVALATLVYTTIGDTVGTLKQKGIDFLLGIYNGVIEKWEDVKAWFNGIGTKVTTAVGAVGATLLDKGKNILGGFYDGVLEKWVTVKAWAVGLPALVLSTVGAVGETLYNAGKNIIGGFLDGMKSKWDEAKSWVKGIGTWIADNKGPKQYDLNLLVPAGGWIMSGLDSGLKAGLPNILSTVQGVTSSILNAASGARNTALQSMTGDAATVARAASTGATGATATATGANASGGDNNFYGDLSFPNITSPDDAEKFLQNLSDLAGSGGR